MSADVGVSQFPGDVDLLSYSRWIRVRSCLLKGAYASTTAIGRLDRSGTHAAVGRARHLVQEQVLKGVATGRPAPTPDWVRQQFDLALARERLELERQWAPAEVPLIRTWPDVALTRARLARDLGGHGHGPDEAWAAADCGKEPLAATPLDPHPQWHQVPACPPDGSAAAELVLVDQDRQLVGRVDRLENRSGHLCVVDFKAGLGQTTQELVAEHREQLLFYAGLVNAVFGEWPDLEICPVGTSPVPVEYDPEDVGRLRSQVMEDRTRLNAALADGALARAASPAEPNCTWCPFQVVCPALRRSWLDIANHASGPLHPRISLAEGEVVDVRSHEHSTEVVLRQPSDLTAPGGDVTVTNLPPALEVVVGSQLAVSRISPAGSAVVLRAAWNSWIWPGPAYGVPKPELERGVDAP